MIRLAGECQRIPEPSMPRKYPPLKPREIIRILRERQFELVRKAGGHHYYTGYTKGKPRVVQVDMKFEVYEGDWLKVVIKQSGLTREEFYGSTRGTAKKISVPYVFSEKR